MTFDEAKAKFSAGSTCPACGEYGHRKPFFVSHHKHTEFGRMSWDCPFCGHCHYSNPADRVRPMPKNLFLRIRGLVGSSVVDHRDEILGDVAI